MGTFGDDEFDDEQPDEPDYQERLEEVERERRRYRLGHASVKHPLRDPLQVVDYLDQDRAWASSTSILLIERMEPEHAFNAVLFLLQNSRAIALAVYLSGTDSDGYLQTQLLVDPIKARSHILSSPLGLALLARAREEATTRRYAWQRP